MKHFFEVIRGSIAVTLIFCNLVFFGLPVMFLGLIKMSSRNMKWQIFWSHPIIWLCSCWVDVCIFVEKVFARITWDIQINTPMSKEGLYLVVSNHQSNSDVPVLMHAIHSRLPFMRFFIKAELKKLPIFGFAWQSVDCPFMGRYTKEQIAQNPSLKHKDLEQTMECCRKFQYMPTSIVNFAEGTRFTPAKHEKYSSKFENLLTPRAGGLAFAIAALEGKAKHLIDITIEYHTKQHGLWDYFCGRVQRISIIIDGMQIPSHFAEKDYFNDEEFRQEFQLWLNDIWQLKDQKIKRLRES